MSTPSQRSVRKPVRTPARKRRLFDIPRAACVLAALVAVAPKSVAQEGSSGTPASGGKPSGQERSGRKQPGQKQPGRKQPGQKQPGRKQPGQKQSGRKQPGASTGDASPEDATLRLRAELAAERLAPADRQRIAGRLLALDPRARDWQRANSAAAARLIDVSEVFRKHRWYRVARHFVEEARRLDPAAAADPLARLRRMSPRTFRGSVAEPDFTKPVPKADWLAFAAKDVYRAGWQIAENLITSPATGKGGRLTYVLCSEPKHADGTVSVEVRRTPDHGLAGFLFGYAHEKDFFYYAVEYGLNTQTVQLFHLVEEEWTQLGTGTCRMTKAQRSGWVRQGVRIRGKHVELFIGEHTILQADCDREAHGRLALFVSGAHGAMPPVEFRRPRVGPLVPKPKVDPRVREDLARHRYLVARLATAASELPGRKEVALLRALRIDRAAALLRDARLRGEVRARVRSIAARSWPQHAELAASLSEIVAQWLRLACAYDAAGWCRTAALVQRCVARIDGRAADGLGAELAAAAEKRAGAEKRTGAENRAGARAGAHTDVDAVAAVDASHAGADNALFETWFKGGRCLHGKPWKFTEECVASDVDGVGEHLMASTRKLGTSGKFRLQLRAGDKPCFAGVVVGFKGWYRYHVLSVIHSRTTSVLSLRRHVDGERSREVGKPRKVEFPAAAKKGWMTIEIEFTGKRLIAKVGKERVSFDTGGEDLSGSIGLYHRADTAGRSVRFRNLVIVAGEARKKKAP